MTKCRKLDLPKCEYLTTGGCVSPFNCSYKAENEIITTAISCNLYSLETDKDREISRLKAEVAELRATLSKMETVEKELRERLEEAVELPRIIHPNEYEWFVQYQNKYGLIFDEIFYSERAAEACLKELKENNND